MGSGGMLRRLSVFIARSSRRCIGADGDHVDLARLSFRFDRHGWSRLRMLIDCLNERPDP